MLWLKWFLDKFNSRKKTKMFLKMLKMHLFSSYYSKKSKTISTSDLTSQGEYKFMMRLHILNYGLAIPTLTVALITLVSYASAQNSQSDIDSELSQLIAGSNSSLPTNLSMSPEFGPTLGMETPEFSLPDVNGTYANPEVGLQIDLPKGWSGKEISFLINSVIAAPQGVDLESSDEPATMMAIQMIDQETFDELANLAQSFGFGGDANESQMPSDPLAIGGSEGEQCEELPVSFVTINGIKAEQRSASCTDEEGATSNVRAYAFATADDTIVLLALVSNSTSEYDQFLPMFEQSVKTIKISEPGDIATSELYRKHKEMEKQNNMTLS